MILQSLTYHKVYSYLLVLNCFLLLVISSAGSSWCFDLENIEQEQAFYIPNNCHSTLAINTSDSSKSHTQKNQAQKTECNFCLDYTFDDVALTGVLAYVDVPSFSLFLATDFQPLPLNLLWDNLSTAEDYPSSHLSNPTTQKSLQTIVLLI